MLDFLAILRYLSNALFYDPHAQAPEQLPMNQDPVVPAVEEKAPIYYAYSFDTHEDAYHSARVICDEEEVTYLPVTCPDGIVRNMKQVICACIEQESHFNNEAVNHNRDKQGRIVSTDYGIVQCNDYWHIGLGKDFPSIQYVVDNPEKLIRWMVRLAKTGHLNLWASFTSMAFKKYL